MADPSFTSRTVTISEMPKSWWAYTGASITFLSGFTKEHPDVNDVEVWSEALNGKILIPQPFGTPK